jgi:hypothetical protein
MSLNRADRSSSLLDFFASELLVSGRPHADC